LVEDDGLLPFGLLLESLITKRINQRSSSSNKLFPFVGGNVIDLLGIFSISLVAKKTIILSLDNRSTEI